MPLFPGFSTAPNPTPERVPGGPYGSPGTSYGRAYSGSITSVQVGQWGGAFAAVQNGGSVSTGGKSVVVFRVGFQNAGDQSGMFAVGLFFNGAQQTISGQQQLAPGQYADLYFQGDVPQSGRYTLWVLQQLPDVNGVPTWVPVGQNFDVNLNIGAASTTSPVRLVGVALNGKPVNCGDSAQAVFPATVSVQVYNGGQIAVPVVVVAAGPYASSSGGATVNPGSNETVQVVLQQAGTYTFVAQDQGTGSKSNACALVLAALPGSPTFQPPPVTPTAPPPSGPAAPPSPGGAATTPSPPPPGGIDFSNPIVVGAAVLVVGLIGAALFAATMKHRGE